MPSLHVGQTIHVVTEGVARAWPAVEAQAKQDASSDKRRAVVWVRTAAGEVGGIAIYPDFPITFTDEGRANGPDGSVVIEASADLTHISAGAHAARDPEPELSDAEMHDLAQELREDRPDLDWDNLLSGRLAGPASPDRPNVPVWDYASFADSHPEVRFSDLTAARFPIRFFEGGSSVTSIDEEVRPLPFSYTALVPKSRIIETSRTVISRYAALHEAGVVEWDPGERGIAFLQPVGSFQAALNAWARTLDRSR